MNFYKKSNLLKVTRNQQLKWEKRNPRAVPKQHFDHIASIDITQFYKEPLSGDKLDIHPVEDTWLCGDKQDRLEYI